MQHHDSPDINGVPELNLYPYRALQNPGDSVTALLYVLDNVSNGSWIIPLHQRKPDAWGIAKQRRYIERQKQAIKGSHPPGVFLTYQLRPHSPVYLNDGLQRATALEHLRDYPQVFGMDSSDVRELLNCTTSVQHRHYDSHDEAMTDFQLINYGTHLTPHELCAGYLTYMPGYEKTWSAVIQGIEAAVEASWHRVGNGKTVNRVTQHKMKRQVLSMILRFIDGVKAPRAYQDVGRKELDLEQTKHTVEWQLKNSLEKMGLEEFKRTGKRLERLILDATALIETTKRSSLGDGAAIVPVLHRWLLDFFVWARNNQVPVTDKEQFVRILLTNTRGKNQWVHGPQDVVTFAFANLGVMPRLAIWSEMPQLIDHVARSKKQIPSRPGYHDSHIDPFVTHGDGRTVKEAASLNLSRGARSMSETELKLLK